MAGLTLAPFHGPPLTVVRPPGGPTFYFLFRFTFLLCTRGLTLLLLSLAAACTLRIGQVRTRHHTAGYPLQSDRASDLPWLLRKHLPTREQRGLAKHGGG